MRELEQSIQRARTLLEQLESAQRWLASGTEKTQREREKCVDEIREQLNRVLRSWSETSYLIEKSQ